MFPNHTSPVIARPSPLQTVRTELVIDAVSGCDDLDLAVLLVLHPGCIDDLVVAENVGLPFVSIASGLLVVDVDVVLSFPFFVVLAFSVELFVVASAFRLPIGQKTIPAGFE
jgi:hypothetical protein